MFNILFDKVNQSKYKDHSEYSDKFKTTYIISKNCPNFQILYNSDVEVAFPSFFLD